MRGSELQALPDGLPTPARYYAVVVVVLGIAMATLDGTIINLALPSVTRDLQASAAQTIWVINAYQITILAFLLPCAALGDVVGYRRVFLCGLLMVPSSVAIAMPRTTTTTA
ncbi:hypothetical protein FACS189475_00010 [Betaproteobacteria bacterium]|nr:hypothetical protein FACS189475_00010 [Betaproteobacteria bacterium]